MNINIENINIENKTCKILKCIINTAVTYLCNLAGTDYEFPEDDAMALKHVEAV